MYNAKNIKEIEPIPAGEVVTGVIINIMDGKARDFLKNEVALAHYKNPDENAINIVVEFKYRNKSYKTERIFTYNVDIDGTPLYSKKSNFAKYIKFYKKAPEIADKVQLVSNAEGYFNLLL